MTVCEGCGAHGNIVTKGEFAGTVQPHDYCVYCSKNLCNACMGKSCNESPTKIHKSSEQEETEHDALPYPHGISCMMCRNNNVCNQCGNLVNRKVRCTNGRCQACCVGNCKHQVVA